MMYTQPNELKGKKITKRSLIFMAVVFCVSMMALSPSTFAATYYVDSNYKGTNENGSSDTPWRTIQKAADTALAGDTVIIRTGVYRETVIPKNSGTSGIPITYKADKGATVTINGTEFVDTKWEHHSGNIYKTNIKLPLGDGDQIFVRNEMMMEASWPNTPSLSSGSDWLVDRTLKTGTNGVKVKQAADGVYYSFESSDYHSLEDPTGGIVYISSLLNHGWNNYTGNVSSYDRSTKTITFKIPVVPGHAINEVGYGNKKTSFYLYGKLGYLDVEKEYFYEPAGVLYLYQKGGGAPSANTVEYKVRDTGFDLRGKKFINIEGIGLFGCNIISNNDSSNMIIDRINAKYLSHSRVYYINSGLSNVPNDIVGIQLFGSNNTIKNSQIEFSFGNGIDVRGSNSTILNNKVTNCNYLGLYSNSIYISGNNHVVSYNTALRSGRSLLGGHFTSTKITNNEFGYANYLSSDGACIYLGFGDFGNSEVAYNYVHHPGNESTSGIYFDAFSYNAIVHHNYTHGLHFNATRSGMLVANNTLFGNRGLVGVNANQSPFLEEGVGANFVYNIITPVDGMDKINVTYQPATKVLNWVTSEIGDPKLENNGSLSPDSLAINYPGVEKLDYIHDNVTDGKPDLGAFERGTPRWEYGHDFSKKRNAERTDFNVQLMNQVSNGGFEEDFDKWTDAFNNIVKGGNLVKRGTAAQLKPNTYVSQKLSGLKPNSKYKFSVWSKTNLNGKGVIEVKGFEGIDISKTANYVPDTSIFTELEFITGAADAGSPNASVTIYLKNIGTDLVFFDQAGVYLEVFDKNFVIFNSNGGSSVSNQAINKNGLAITPTTPIRKGFTFDGWYSEGNRFNFATPIAKTTILKAKWKQTDYNYDMTKAPLLINPNPISSSATIKSGPGEFWGPDSNFTDGKLDTFADINAKIFPARSVSLEMDFGTVKPVLFDTIVINDNSTIKGYDIMVSDDAKTWTTISREKNNLNWGYVDKALEYADALPRPLIGRHVKFVIKSRADGYTYSVKLYELKILYNGYIVNFNSNDGTMVDQQVVRENEKTQKPNNPDRLGHTFDGWFLDKALRVSYDFNAPTTANMTLYAKWTAVATKTPTPTPKP